jgi:hypothetical protein
MNLDYSFEAKEVRDGLVRLGAEIGAIELRRMTGEYVPISELLNKKQKFSKLSRAFSPATYKRPPEYLVRDSTLLRH